MSDAELIRGMERVGQEVGRLQRECDMRADDNLKLCKEIDGLRAELASDREEWDKVSAEMEVTIENQHDQLVEARAQRDYQYDCWCACEREKTELVRQLNEQKAITNDWRETAGEIAKQRDEARKLLFGNAQTAWSESHCLICGGNHGGLQCPQTVVT